MDMEQFRILCTPKQTKKALELGAPIIKVDTTDKRMIYYGRLCYPRTEADYPYAIPTAEEMIGWIEEQGISIEICLRQESKEYEYYIFGVKPCEAFFSSRKEATIAAINAALEYLSKE